MMTQRETAFTNWIAEFYPTLEGNFYEPPLDKKSTYTEVVKRLKEYLVENEETFVDITEEGYEDCVSELKGGMLVDMVEFLLQRKVEHPDLDRLMEDENVEKQYKLMGDFVMKIFTVPNN